MDLYIDIDKLYKPSTVLDSGRNDDGIKEESQQRSSIGTYAIFLLLLFIIILSSSSHRSSICGGGAWVWLLVRSNIRTTAIGSSSTDIIEHTATTILFM
jgi:hypothetical protein